MCECVSECVSVYVCVSACVIVFDPETKTMRRPMADLGYRVTEKVNNKNIY